MRRAEHGVLDGDPRVMRAELQRAEGLKVALSIHDAPVSAIHQPPGLAGEQVRGWVPRRGDVALHGVGDGVIAGCGPNRGGLRYRQDRVENRYSECGLRVAAGHLDVRDGVGDQGVALGFAARAGRGGDADHGEHRLRGLTVALVIRNFSAVRQDEVDAFGAIHGAAAA